VECSIADRGIWGSDLKFSSNQYINLTEAYAQSRCTAKIRSSNMFGYSQRVASLLFISRSKDHVTVTAQAGNTMS